MNRKMELEVLDDDELDELVTDYKCEEAAEINNQGRESQIEWILKYEEER